MNKQTLDRLSQNPHYKLNKKQQEEAGKLDRKPMAAFGDFNRNENKFETHPTNPVRINEHSKKPRTKTK